MITRKQVEGTVMFYELLRERLAARLKELPEGRIYYKEEHGKKRPYTYANGKEEYLGRKKIDLIRGLLQRLDIERAQRRIANNLYALELLLQDFLDINEVIPESLSVRCTNLVAKSKEEIANLVHSWEGIVAGTPKYDPGENKTSDGTYVKSRAELAIYEFLLSLGVTFMYEKPTIINGETWYPDFTIIRASDGAEIIWEFFGLLHIPKYYKDSQWKLFHYAGAGYWPGVNLIITCAYGDDKIDLMAAKEMLIALGVIHA